jgi:hypothetical protein
MELTARLTKWSDFGKLRWRRSNRWMASISEATAPSLDFEGVNVGAVANSASFQSGRSSKNREAFGFVAEPPSYSSS